MAMSAAKGAKRVRGDAKRVQGDAERVRGDAKRVQGNAKRVKVGAKRAGAKRISANESRRAIPETQEFKEFMLSSWAKRGEFDFRNEINLKDLQAAAKQRRKNLYNEFALRVKGKLGEGFLLAIPAGVLKARSNDCDYMFRPYSAFSYLTGLGEDYEPGAILLIESPGQSVLFTPEPKDTSTDAFFKDGMLGSFWIGNRPAPKDFQRQTGIRTLPLTKFAAYCQSKSGKQNKKNITGIGHLDPAVRQSKYSRLLEQCASELRFVKDKIEIAELQSCVDKTQIAFENVIRNLPEAVTAKNGERVIETKFHEVARQLGNWEGYDTIAASGQNATILHWTRNYAPVKSGDMVLLDAGIENRSLYTADITRTIPVSGKYSKEQREIYDAVQAAADNAFLAAKPGNKFMDVHKAAMEVIKAKLHELGFLPINGSEKLEDDGAFYRRWMCHGTSHHLGLDVHDCAKARNQLYRKGVIKEGMCFTIEPGLYFRPDDELVPKKYRGIGVRIEDNIVITKDGNLNLSRNIPRTADGIEKWVKSL